MFSDLKWQHSITCKGCSFSNYSPFDQLLSKLFLFSSPILIIYSPSSNSPTPLFNQLLSKHFYSPTKLWSFTLQALTLQPLPWISYFPKLFFSNPTLIIYSPSSNSPTPPFDQLCSPNCFILQPLRPFTLQTLTLQPLPLMLLSKPFYSTTPTLIIYSPSSNSPTPPFDYLLYELFILQPLFDQLFSKLFTLQSLPLIIYSPNLFILQPLYLICQSPSSLLTNPSFDNLLS